MAFLAKRRNLKDMAAAVLAPKVSIPPLSIGGKEDAGPAERPPSPGVRRLLGVARDMADEENLALDPPAARLQRNAAVVRVKARVGGSIEDWGYDAGGQLGFGTMGTVNRVRRCADKQEFACKHVSSIEDEQIAMLRQEYELMTGLHNAGIVSPEAFHESPGNAWLCMELCADGNVEAAVRHGGAFQEGRARAFARQLLLGVDYLHCRRIVHRDIKPENLLLTDGANTLKIGDFGSAQRVGCAAAGHAMLSARGTQVYQAPELRFGRQWNERVDVWAAGLCVFFMAKSELPFDGGSRKSVKRLQAGRLPAVCWGSMSDETRDLVELSLRVDMRERPTAMELAQHPALAGPAPGVSSERASHLDWVPACGLLFSQKHRELVQQRPRRPFQAALAALVRSRSMGGRGPAVAHESPL